MKQGDLLELEFDEEESRIPADEIIEDEEGDSYHCHHDWYHRGYDEVYLQQQRMLSTSSKHFLKKSSLQRNFEKSFSTSSHCQFEWKDLLKTPFLLRRYRILKDLYNYKALVDPTFNEAEFLEGCKMVSGTYKIIPV